ncbi:hypothetical protein GWC77_15325 [Paraburkholderia sp. NMBU_R16]|uniref:hypothetical protein n=1 Tax=Paraburkholderia sp. NMBU_R16 TaxID=2698676 RepID=UPI0015666245|nr:hypothetical protein [Paraburkholderia sp. NMBU_R16]NRO97295.1 hypothetical protein [Paraburkholderia sp. NMBU_R16]
MSEPGTPALAAAGHGGNEGDALVDESSVGHDHPQDSRDEPPAERLDTDLFGALETLNLDPRQGTLAGFELPADALDSLRARAEAQRAAAAEREAETMPPPTPETGAASPALHEPAPASMRAQVIPQPAGARIADIAAYLRVDDAAQSGPADGPARNRLQPAKRGWTSGPAQGPSSSSSLAPPSADSPASGSADAIEAAQVAQTASTAALAETVAALSRSLAEERRAAAASRRRSVRLLTIMACASVLMLALAIAQFVVLARVARESAATQQKTEALLRSQQLALAAFLDTASGAAADIRGTADAMAGRLAALPSRQGAAPGAPSASGSTLTPSAKHARAAHTHRGG